METTVRTTPPSPISLRYWDMLKELNDSVKIDLLALLISSLREEKTTEEEKCKSDEEFVRELQALHYDGEPTVEEKKRFIRESHHFVGRNINYAYCNED